MNTEVGGGPLTAREQEVARLIGQGLTNKEIATRLRISDRTVGAHIQNILNKLGASNRAQIAAWSAQRLIAQPTGVPVAAAKVQQTSRALRMPARALAFVGAGLAIALLLSADHPRSSASGLQDAVSTYEQGNPVFIAQLLAADGQGFSSRELYGDPTASSIRFVRGSVEYSVVKPGGRTGNELAVRAMPAYFAEFDLSVQPGSDVTFWINLTTGVFPTGTGQHIVAISTAVEVMQMAYFISRDSLTLALGPEVEIQGLQAGRRFTVAVLVAPPRYVVFLDGSKAIDLLHGPNPTLHSPSLTIFGDGVGTVRLGGLRVYAIT